MCAKGDHEKDLGRIPVHVCVVLLRPRISAARGGASRVRLSSSAEASAKGI